MIRVNHSNHKWQLQNYRIGLRARHLRTGAVTDIEEAIHLAREILSMTPEYSPDRAEKLNGLANSLGDRYLRLGAMSDLDESVQVARKAVDAAPEGYPNRALYLNDLAVPLADRYKRTGAITDLEEAIQATAQAVNITPEDHPQWAMYLSNLGDQLVDRYSRTQAMNDLEESIRIVRRSVDATPASNHILRAGRLHNLGRSLALRYSRTGTSTDLEGAIQEAKQAVDMISRENPNWTMFLSGLGVLLSARYSRTEELADLEEGIRFTRQALAATPKNHPDQAAKLNNLGTELKKRYLRIGDIGDLQEAIQLARQALHAAPEDHPIRAYLLKDLGSGLIKRAKKTRKMADFKEAIIHLQSALRQSNASIIHRITAGHAVLLACTAISDWQMANEASNIAVNLIPQLISRSLENSDKQYVLRQVVGVASDAAAVAIKGNKEAVTALTYLEQGRGVLAASIEEMRTDILDLRRKYPELANKFVHLRDELDHAATYIDSVLDQEHISSFQGEWTQHYNTSNELNEVIIEIRQQPGFEDFLIAPDGKEMQAAAMSGPIIVINVSTRRCDAILVERHQIRVLPLPHLDIKEIRKNVQRGSLGSPIVLEWLWDVAANPIMDALGFTGPPFADNWPHIWWIPTGLLSKFPLHAAGRHRSGFAETVLDRAMSSYSTSIKAIIHSRRRRIISTAPAKVLLVAMQNTPEHSSLPFSVKEVAMLHNLCRSAGFNSIEPGRTKEDVISHLPSCMIFHFAGHGYTDTKNPLRSTLLLDDWRGNPLTVATLLEMNLREGSPFLAYLSACGTGQIEDNKSVDESIHLISACQLAGFRHVIGTLWKVNDETCVDVSRVTYREIQNEDMTDESVCRGLHKAVRELRQRWLDQSLRWEDRSAKKADTHLTDNTSWPRNTRDGSQCNDRLPRVVVLCDDDEDTQFLPWAPYVHFGV
jgi:tetratricopeptide (TPR) repeat protein